MGWKVPGDKIEKDTSKGIEERAFDLVDLKKGTDKNGEYVLNDVFVEKSLRFLYDFSLLEDAKQELLSKNVNGGNKGDKILRPISEGHKVTTKDGKQHNRYYPDASVSFENGEEYLISSQWSDKARRYMLSLIFDKAHLSPDITESLYKKYDECNVKKEEATDEESFDTCGVNLIIYGAPGTGKSHYVEHEMNLDKDKITRIVFHPEYTYFDFIGQYRPYPLYKNTNGKFVSSENRNDADDEPFIDYNFIPGPFTKVLVEACKEKKEHQDEPAIYTLLIEELNRADAAAVFGDVFQLLDRKDGESEYGIVPSPEWGAYLKKEGVLPEDGKIRIPSNMNIIATMNSADQGVHVLDTAFKRRWDYKFMSIGTNESSIANELNVRYTKDAVGWNTCTWKNLLDVINEKLIGTVGIAEDRLVGPFFVKPEIVKNEKGKYAIEKILFYLWDDVLRNNDRESFFDNDLKTMSQLYKAFEAGKDVMGIKDKLNLKPEPQDNENTQVEQAENQGETSAENNTGNNGQAQ